MKKSEDITNAAASGGDRISRRDFILGTSGVAMAATTPITAMTASKATLGVPAQTYTALPAGRQLRIGVVGGNFGLAFPWHLHPNCQVTAVADLLSERRDALKNRFACDNVYGEFHPMLKDPAVDAVAIYTDAPDHARHCIDILRAGKHAVTVIPAAVSLEDCQTLIETVKATGRVYMYGETGCFHPATMASRIFFKEERYGHVYYTAGEYTHSVYTGPAEEVMKPLLRDGKKTWRWGFPQGWYSGHAIGPIIHATRDRYVDVSAVGMEYAYAPFKDNRYGNPFVNTTFFFRSANGSASNIKVHWMTGAPAREGADIYGTKMYLMEDRDDRSAAIYYPDQAPVALDLSALNQALPPPLRDVSGHGGAHPQIIHEFVSACIEERTPLVDVYQAATMAAAGIVGFQSALKGGERLSIPDFALVT